MSSRLRACASRAASPLGLACVAAAVTLVALVSPARAEPALRDGDLIFQVSRSSQSLAIQRATRSRYSHVGMVVYRAGEPFVLEAAARVRYTPIAAFVARGEGGHYVVKRLRASAGRFDLAKALAVARELTGKPYDYAFDWSDARMYCSELVWKIYQRALGIRLGEPQPLGSYHLDDPVVQKKLRERYGATPPLDEPMISPAAVFDSALLELVVEHPESAPR